MSTITLQPPIVHNNGHTDTKPASRVIPASTEERLAALRERRSRVVKPNIILPTVEPSPSGATTPPTPVTPTGSPKLTIGSAKRRTSKSKKKTSPREPKSITPPASPHLTPPTSPRSHTNCGLTIGRKPSLREIEEQKKSEYWKDVERTAQQQGVKISRDDLNHVISRAMTLGIVGDEKHNESLEAPQFQELLATLKSSMERRIVELVGGKQINFDSFGPSNATMMDKILSLERALTFLETRKAQLEEEEKKRVQNKISEIERALRTLEAQKLQRKESRCMMKHEITNLKEMMAKAQKEKIDETAATAETKALAVKVKRLEIALRLMNKDRKKGTAEQDARLLRQKLALFEQRLHEMEAAKVMREEQEQGNSLRDRLSHMEDRFEKMLQRKVSTRTLQIQQKMEQVEKQIETLRTEKDATNANIAKIVLLEKQLQALAKTKATPQVIQDEETVALRNQIKKLEDCLAQQERRMDEQRIRIEEERKRNYEKRLAEEEELRRQAKQKEEELVRRITQMEERIKAGGLDPELITRLDKLESMGSATVVPDITSKILDLEKKLEETQKKLEDERKAQAEFFSTVPKEGSELESWQKDVQIKWLMETHEKLRQKLEEATKQIDIKMKEFMEAGGKFAQKSGLSYEHINAKLAEIQSKLFDPNIDKNEAELLNIEYEKLITELEQTPEYQNLQEELKNQWKKENEAPNKEAFDKVYLNLKSMPDNKLNAVFKRKPELKFILYTPDQLLKAHANDFRHISTQNLLLIEARALYHNMPAFRRDQEQQSQFVEQLRLKIETESKKPPVVAPPIEPKRKVELKIKKNEASGDFLQELLEKRKRCEENC